MRVEGKGAGLLDSRSMSNGTSIKEDYAKRGVCGAPRFTD